jgi:hypothetical protein
MVTWRSGARTAATRFGTPARDGHVYERHRTVASLERTGMFVRVSEYGQGGGLVVWSRQGWVEVSGRGFRTAKGAGGLESSGVG